MRTIFKGFSMAASEMSQTKLTLIQVIKSKIVFKRARFINKWNRAELEIYSLVLLRKVKNSLQTLSEKVSISSIKLLQIYVY